MKRATFTTKIKIILIALFLNSFFAISGEAQSCSTCTTSPCLNLTWNKSYNNSFSDQDYGRAVTTDASGNVYVTGQATVGASTYKDRAVVTIKYNSAGVQQWVQTYSNTNNASADDDERGNAIGIDANNGNVWVAAKLQNGTTNKYDMALLEYNSSGTLLSGYPKYYAEASTNYDFTEASSIVVKDATHVYVGGTSTTNGNYYGKALMNNPSGGWYWSTSYTFSGSNLTNTPCAEVYDMKLNAAGTYLYITGVVNNGIAGADTYLAKIDASTTGGTANWTQTYAFSGGGDDLSYAIYLDGSDISYLVGKTYTSTQGNDGFIMKYNSSGTQQWVSTYNYASHNLDDAYVDIGGSSSNGSSVVYVTGYRTAVSSGTKNADYITAAYNISNGLLNSSWTQNPKAYDGSAVGAAGNGEPLYTDHAYALEYDATNNKVFVTGRSFDTLCPGTSPNINITTLRYNGATGAQEWKASYDYGTDGVNMPDEVDTKYALAIQNNVSCTGVDAFVTGENWGGSTQWFNALTLKYSVNCCPSCGNPPRLMNPLSDSTTLFPNPFSSTATLNVGGDLISNATLSIYDVTGKSVRVISAINSNTIEIEKGDLMEGIYFYKLTNTDGIIASGKFILIE